MIPGELCLVKGACVAGVSQPQQELSYFKYSICFFVVEVIGIVDLYCIKEPCTSHIKYSKR